MQRSAQHGWQGAPSQPTTRGGQPLSPIPFAAQRVDPLPHQLRQREQQENNAPGEHNLKHRHIVGRAACNAAAGGRGGSGRRGDAQAQAAGSESSRQAALPTRALHPPASLAANPMVVANRTLAAKRAKPSTSGEALCRAFSSSRPATVIAHPTLEAVEPGCCTGWHDRNFVHKGAEPAHRVG